MQQMTGKQLRFRSGFPVQSSSTSSEVRNDEPKLPIRPRETSTERVGGSIARRNSLGSYGYQDYKYDSRDGQRNGGQTRYSRFPNDVPTTTRKRSISRDELEEVNSKKPRKDSEVATKTRVDQSKLAIFLKQMLTRASLRVSVPHVRMTLKDSYLPLLNVRMSARMSSSKISLPVQNCQRPKPQRRRALRLDGIRAQTKISLPSLRRRENCL